MTSSVKIAAGAIQIDGRPVQIISGAMHYFRIPREYWRDRIAKAAMLGLNAIETYMPWNLHELKEGRFDFSGMLDFEAYLEAIRDAGLYAIVRPGPYICAEWDNGGLPPWLSLKPGMEFRRMNGPFLEAVDRYYDQVLPRLRKLQHTCGGPVIAVQVENEYGSYCCDHRYLKHLYDRHLRHGIDVILFTSDGPEPNMLNGGTIPECFQTVNFGSRPEEAFAIGRRYRPEGPDFCMEYWNGWFDHWGEEHHTRDAGDAAATLDALLKTGAGVNLYMFHGGTNFGFTNGANGNLPRAGEYAPTVTSYDYDAALKEDGDPSDKFLRFQHVIRRYRPDAPFAVPPDAPKFAPEPTPLTGRADLLEQVDRLASNRVDSVSPLTQEALGESFGFVHYRTRLAGAGQDLQLHLIDVNDRASAYLDGRYLGTVYRNDERATIDFHLPAHDCELELLVENMGRINYGPLVGRDLKGIAGTVTTWLQSQVGWENRALPLDDLSRLEFTPAAAAAAERPTFYRGCFQVDVPADTFIRRPGVKGLVWVNGHNLGRYWEAGPTRTLYVPGCWLKPGDNEIVVLELHRLNRLAVEWLDHAELG